MEGIENRKNKTRHPSQWKTKTISPQGEEAEEGGGVRMPLPAIIAVERQIERYQQQLQGCHARHSQPQHALEPSVVVQNVAPLTSVMMGGERVRVEKARDISHLALTLPSLLAVLLHHYTHTPAQHPSPTWKEHWSSSPPHACCWLNTHHDIYN